MNPINITLTILSILTVISLGAFLYFYMNKNKSNQNKPDNTKKSSNRVKGMEVYHIYNNTHTYPMAKEKCKMYGGRLATESEVRRAHEDGANWCNYGWSHGQKILFPAQKQAVDFEDVAISKINPKKCDWHNNNKCQKEGVNGGYYSNPNLKVGINCFGLRPEYLKNDDKLRTKDDKERKEVIEKIRKHDQSYKNELLKQRNQERLRENVRKSIVNDMISDYNNVVNKPRYETVSNDKVKFFENQEADFP